MVRVNECYLVATVWGEARGEPIKGQIAVAQVIKNRSIKKKRSIKDIVLEPKQFSCWNKRDPNYDECLKIVSEWKDEWWDLKNVPNKFLLKTIVACKSSLDVVDGATHYVTLDYYNKNRNRGWISKMKVVGIIGNHIFMKE